MQETLYAAIDAVLALLALPSVGLSAIFLVGTVAATLLPLGSEPIVFAYVRAQPDMLWAAIAAATAGNTLGGVITYAMGRGARTGYERWQEKSSSAESPVAAPAQDRWHRHAERVLQRWGPPAMLLAWLPVVGDPLCAVAGWLRFRFWPSLVFMAIGKGLRYIAITGGLLWLFPAG
ncbi:DedA family protein [Achromobacter sp. GG226]|uniref:YqaA family protein n=1 Tax=Verticiella alkaliphila TaxID=2779529 RepID=UPI001C0D125F|nr:YqaA family protein [Verticiella sp. GG226]MBU4611086.1 DedA family protein [Verticiella sp. GG226]